MVKYTLILLLILPSATCVDYTLKSLLKIDSQITRILIGTFTTSTMLIGTTLLLRDEL